MKNKILTLIGFVLNVLAVISPRLAAKLGLNLFCYPFRVPVSARQRKFLSTAVQSSFHHKGIRIQTYRWGSGPMNILLLHGWQSHTYRWKKYIESLSLTEYTIYALDAPGHGQSSGRFLHVPLYSEVISMFMMQIGTLEGIIGHSIGGFSALYTLHRDKDLTTNNLVTLASPGEVGEFLEFYQNSLSLSDRMMNLIERRFEEKFFLSPSDFSAPVFASSLKVPGLIIHDVEDLDAPVIHSKRIHNAWKNSRLVMTRGFGHNLKSEDVVAEVIEFFNQRTKAPASLTWDLT
jgi:pimeloyl-ACP methyl ester carboxylesterase